MVGVREDVLISQSTHRIGENSFSGVLSCPVDVHTVLSGGQSIPCHDNGVWSRQNGSDDRCYSVYLLTMLMQKVINSP